MTFKSSLLINNNNGDQQLWPFLCLLHGNFHANRKASDYIPKAAHGIFIYSYNMNVVSSSHYTWPTSE